MRERIPIILKELKFERIELILFHTTGKYFGVLHGTTFSCQVNIFNRTLVMHVIRRVVTNAQARIQESAKGGGGRHFSKFSTRVAKMSISISSEYSHEEEYIRMLLAYSVFL